MKSAEPSDPKHTQSGSERPSVLLFVLLAAALLIFILVFERLSPILLSLLLILLISLALNPVVIRMQKWTGGRRGATGVLVLLLFAILGLTGWAFSVPMKDSVTKFSNQLPEYWERIQKPLIKLEQKAANTKEKLEAEVSTEIARNNAEPGEFNEELPSAETAQHQIERESTTEAKPESDSGSVLANVGTAFQGIAGSFTSMAFNAAHMLIVLVTVFFGVTFTLMNPHPIFGAMFALVPKRHHYQALTIIQRIGDFVPRWAGATFVGMTSIGLLVFILMWPFFGFTDALVLGLIAGVFESVPFIGPILSFIPAILLAFGEGGLTPVWVVIAYLVVQALESNVIMPMVMAKGMQLHPLAVIFSMLLCVSAFGVLGVLVAAPLVAIVSILHEELYRKRFLPTVSDADLDRLSHEALHEMVPTHS